MFDTLDRTSKVCAVERWHRQLLTSSFHSKVDRTTMESADAQSISVEVFGHLNRVQPTQMRGSQSMHVLEVNKSSASRSTATRLASPCVWASIQSFLQPLCNATMLDTEVPAEYTTSFDLGTLQLPDDLDGGSQASIDLSLPSDCTRPAIYLSEASSRTQLREGRMDITPYTDSQTSRKRYNSTFAP